MSDPETKTPSEREVRDVIGCLEELAHQWRHGGIGKMPHLMDDASSLLATLCNQRDEAWEFVERGKALLAASEQSREVAERALAASEERVAQLTKERDVLQARKDRRANARKDAPERKGE